MFDKEQEIWEEIIRSRDLPRAKQEMKKICNNCEFPKEWVDECETIMELMMTAISISHAALKANTTNLYIRRIAENHWEIRAWKEGDKNGNSKASNKPS